MKDLTDQELQWLMQAYIEALSKYMNPRSDYVERIRELATALSERVKVVR